MTSIYFRIDFNTQEEAIEVARKVNELSSQGVEGIIREPPKLVIYPEEVKYLIYPEILMVERQGDREGRIIREGVIISANMNFKMEISSSPL